MSRSKLSLGNKGEDIAVSYLQERGFKIIGRNVRSGRWGELDIVAIEQRPINFVQRLLPRRQQETLVFVEVKTRTTHQYGSPVEAVNYYKLRALKRAAHYYKLRHPELPEAMRIDVMAVLLDPLSEEVLEVSFYRDATVGTNEH